MRWLWEFQVNANATHRSKGYKSLINPFIAFNTKREKEAYIPVSSLIADTTYSAICSFDEIYLFSQFIRLAKWQFDSSFVPWTESVGRFADWTTVLSVFRSFHSIFFFTPVINSFTFPAFFHGLVWLTASGSRNFRKKFRDYRPVRTFFLAQSIRDKNKKRRWIRKWMNIVTFFHVDCSNIHFCISHFLIEIYCWLRNQREYLKGRNKGTRQREVTIKCRH